jgi:comEA protein
MLGFSKQEQRLLLFLLFSFLVGLVAKQIKNQQDKKPELSWEERYSGLYRTFTEKSRAPEKAGVFPETTAGQKSDLKKALIGKININTATGEQLQILPRIGPSMSQRIIQYRRERGPFTSIDAIKKVKGIGDKTFEKIKSQITID